jgi:hypothetical protein
MLSRCSRLILLILIAFCAACGAQTVQPTDTAIPTVVTREPTSTPSPSPTAATPAVTRPAPRIFTEEFNSMPSFWSFLQIDNGQAFAGPSLRDGFLVFDLEAANQWAYAIYGGQTYGDILVEAQAQYRTSGDGAVGLVCRYDEVNGWYEFNVYADQTYQLLFGQWLAPGVARYTPLYQGTSEAVKSDSNQIGLRCQGNALTPSVNGLPLRSWQELKFGLKTGKVGLAASSFEDAPFTVGFDSVKVSFP